MLTTRRPERHWWRLVALLVLCVVLFGVVLAGVRRAAGRPQGRAKPSGQGWYRLTPSQRLDALGSRFRRP